MKNLLQSKLDAMKEKDIIMKQTKATAWVSNLLCTAKLNGDIRVYLNPKLLNEVVKRPRAEDGRYHTEAQKMQVLLNTEPDKWILKCLHC